MEFQQIPCQFLRTVGRETASQEETLEVRLPESMPDIGRVLCAWGQPLLRSKEWRGSGMGITGGVMAWVLYAPEDGTEPRCMEAWIPFQRSWEFSDSQRDGFLRMQCGLSAMDARSLSARKLMLRAGLWFLAEGMELGQESVAQAPQVPEDVQLLEQSYPVTLPREAGEKSFVLDEEMQLPTEMGGEKILSYSLHPELTDQKVMGDKVVFRGSALGHAVLRCREGELRGWDFEVPFSQYGQLDREYGPEAMADVLPAVTNLELELQDGGSVRLKAGIVGQYLVYDRTMIQIVLDAYSPRRVIKQEVSMLSLPALLERTEQTLTVQRPWENREEEPLELSFYLNQPEWGREGETYRVELSGNFQLLGKTPEGSWQGSGIKWEGEKELPAAADSKLFARAQISGRPKVTAGELRCDMRTHMSFFTEAQIPMVSALELGELQPADPKRPSWILRRPDGESLWTIAKHTGSTVEAIRKANNLTADPDPDRILLIPVP